MVQVDDAFAPTAIEYCPAEQLVQLDEPVLDWKYPAAQVVHTDGIVNFQLSLKL